MPDGLRRLTKGKRHVRVLKQTLLASAPNTTITIDYALLCWTTLVFRMGLTCPRLSLGTCPHPRRSPGSQDFKHDNFDDSWGLRGSDPLFSRSPQHQQSNPQDSSAPRAPSPRLVVGLESNPSTIPGVLDLMQGKNTMRTWCPQRRTKRNKLDLVFSEPGNRRIFYPKVPETLGIVEDLIFDFVKAPKKTQTWCSDSPGIVKDLMATRRLRDRKSRHRRITSHVAMNADVQRKTSKMGKQHLDT